MKDSGIAWIGKIPEHWKVKRLKFSSKIELSSVDRHLNNDEEQVLICHYPHVYNNEKITRTTQLDKGTCTVTELEKFRLKKDDVIITKDSESPDDIGVPVFVVEDMEKSVCGYHLAQVTSDKKQLLGNFLFRFLETNISKAYFEINSHGVTRFGLGKDSIGSLFIIQPSICEQEQVSKFLDRETFNIDSQIRNNKKLIELLKEKRQAIINQAITKGIDSKVPMKDSGIEWIGKIPKHWKINKIKFTSYVKGRIGWQGLRSDEFTKEGPYLVTGTEFKDGKVDWKNCYHVEPWRYEQDPYIQVKNDDVLITKDGTIGKIALVENIPGPTTLNSGVMVIRQLHNSYLPKFMYWILQSEQFTQYVEYVKTGSTIKHLYQETFENLIFSHPESLDEQKQISHFIEIEISKVDSLTLKIEYQIKKLEEFRQSLISSAVTGKIDLRDEIII